LNSDCLSKVSLPFLTTSTHFTFLARIRSLVVDATVTDVGLRSGRGRSVAESARASLDAGPLLVDGPVDDLQVVVVAVVSVEKARRKVDVSIHPDLEIVSL